MITTSGRKLSWSLICHGNTCDSEYTHKGPELCHCFHTVCVVDCETVFETHCPSCCSSRWEREGWRPPRPPLHLGQRTHMITWLWTWTRSCQTLFGPRGLNRVWLETCWKVRTKFWASEEVYLIGRVPGGSCIGRSGIREEMRRTGKEAQERRGDGRASLLI